VAILLRLLANLSAWGFVFVFVFESASESESGAGAETDLEYVAFLSDPGLGSFAEEDVVLHRPCVCHIESRGCRTDSRAETEEWALRRC
jgi:hypothetical protein